MGRSVHAAPANATKGPEMELELNQMGKRKHRTENKYNYAWQDRIMIFTGKTPCGLEVVEDGLKKGFGSLGTDLILELGD